MNSGQTCDSADDGVVANTDDDASGRAFNGIGRVESQVLGLQRAFVGHLHGPDLRLGLSSDGRVVDLERQLNDILIIPNDLVSLSVNGM